MCAVLTSQNAKSESLSAAHEKSRFAIIDPAYDPLHDRPAPDIKTDSAPWLYGEAELECWRLQVLREQSRMAGLKIGYPGTYHTPSPQCTFRLELDAGQALPEALVFRAVGDVVVSLGNRDIYRAAASEKTHHVVFPKDRPPGAQTLRIGLSTRGEPPALLVEKGPLSTDLAPWRWSADGTNFEKPKPFAQTLSGVPPHQVEPGEITLKPRAREGDLFDMGCELFGRITFACAGRPALFVGESPAEAKNSNPSYFEQSPALKSNGDGTWTSEHPLAFRYFRITGGEPSGVRCLALFSPAQYRGAFACSDETLTRVWMSSAYTLRLCRHDFLIDGVKRDRLPWVGDLAMSLMANAYAFGDGEIVRRSLVALGRAGIGKTHLNGIVDYSMWWIIAQDCYQLYYSDPDHLHREWPRIKDTLDRLESRSGPDGLYLTAPKDWVFIDWGSEDKQTALQIIWWWAQTSGAKLAERMGDGVTAAHLRSRADLLRKTLYSHAWDASAGSWRAKPDDHSGPSRHADIFAVVSGLAEPAQGDVIRAALSGDKLKPVGTPYVAGFENIALARLGAMDPFISRVNACWGGMLGRGATTFWEAYDPGQTGDNAYGFYRRPYAKSLCHAWSAGPAAFLPAEICGIRPLADGWTRFAVDPQLGSLQWACATVPTPHGDIQISADSRRVLLRVPPGTTAVMRGQTFAGPGCYTLQPR